MPLLIRIPLALLLLGLGSALSALAVVIGLYFHYSPGLPAVDSLREVQLETPLRVYTADGYLIGEFAEKRRIPVTIDGIPERVQQAFIAAEDERFLTHHGVDPVGILRAAMNLFATGERSQGGSTITMQLARNFFLTRDRTYERKIREIFLALHIERELTKDQILELYLNKIYLGQRAYGIGAAAHVYFGRTLDELELHEIAILAGLPKAPSTTNPVTSPERATVRRNYVLRRMLELDYISEAEFVLARAQPVLAQLHSVVTETEAHWVAEAARQAVVNLWGEAAYTRGLRITTTIDSKMQESANAALRAGLLAYDRRHGYRGPEMTLDQSIIDDATARRSALRTLAISGRQLIPAVVIEVNAERLRVETARLGEIVLHAEDLEWARPRGLALPDWLGPGDIIRIQQTGGNEPRWEIAQRPLVAGSVIAQASEDGAILALSGGFDFFENRFDRSLQAQRQPGSAFKPLIYALALEHGMNPISTVVDAPLVLTDPALGAEWRPENYTRRFHGPTSMREALAQSRNLASIRLLDGLGVANVHSQMTRFGLALTQHPRNLSLALGTGSLTPAEINNAYGVFASGGRLNTPWLIAHVEDARGTVYYRAPTRRACGEACEGSPGQDLNLRTSGEVSLHFVEPVATLAPGAAWQMSQMLRETIRSGTGRRALELGRSDLAGKTGTTNSYRDAWFVGFNAEVVATAWIGFDDNRELEARESGARAALPIWMDFMRLALAGRPEMPVPRPEDLVEIALLPETGERTTHNDPRGRREWLMPEQIPERSARLPRDSVQSSGSESQAIERQPEFIF